MEWLKDPKNQPKVAIALSILIVVVLVVMYFVYFKQPGDTSTTSASVDTGMPAETQPMDVPGGQPPAAETPPPAASTQVASSEPIEAWRSDPFMPQGYKPPKNNGPKPNPPITDFPFITLPSSLKEKPAPPPELVQPSRRMAGILVNDSIYAIIETNGESEIVQPGDTLKDRLAVVEKIERDKVLLKTKDAKPRYIVVRMASSTHTPSFSNSGTVDSSMSPSSAPMYRPKSSRNRGTSGGPEADFN